MSCTISKALGGAIDLLAQTPHTEGGIHNTPTRSDSSSMARARWMVAVLSRGCSSGVDLHPTARVAHFV
jgi:hypothetical protein